MCGLSGTVCLAWRHVWCSDPWTPCWSPALHQAVSLQQGSHSRFHSRSNLVLQHPVQIHPVSLLCMLGSHFDVLRML